MKEQKLKRVTDGDRRRMKLSVSQNKRSRKWQEAKLDSEFGPHTCGHCRAEPCGACWPHAACCHRCTHPPMPRWKLSHVLWYRKKPYYVMEVAARRPGREVAEAAPGLGLGAWGGEPASDRASKKRPSEPGSGSGSGRGSKSERARTSLVPETAPSPKPQAGERSEPSPLEDEIRWGVQRSPAARETVTDALYYRWDGICQWVRRARTHYFLGVRVSPVEFLRNLPNDEERAEFAPRDRPPNPFEEGIVENEGREEGDAFSDQTEPAPQAVDDGARYYKRGLQVSELEDEEDDDGKHP